MNEEKPWWPAWYVEDLRDDLLVRLRSLEERQDKMMKLLLEMEELVAHMNGAINTLGERLGMGDEDDGG